MEKFLSEQEAYLKRMTEKAQLKLTELTFMDSPLERCIDELKKKCSKLMECYNLHLPARINGIVVKIDKMDIVTKLDPTYQTWRSGFEFGWSPWTGEYDEANVIDIDLSVF